MDSLKTVWQDASSKDIWAFYCPQCKIPRRVPYRPKPAPKHYAQVVLTSVVFTLLTAGWFSWKGVVIFLPLWIGFEVVYRGRVRAALHCEQCGFDPVLYLVDVKRARREIEQHWKKKFEEKGIPYPPPKNEAVKTAQPKAKPPVVNPTGLEEELANARGPRSTQ